MMHYRKEISNEAVAELELIQYQGPITVIESVDGYRRESARIRSEPALGFDTETRPSFKKGRVYPTSLVQLASENHAWIVRVGKMGYPRELMDLFSSEGTLKVGSGLNDDLRRLRSDHQFEPRGFLDLQQYVEAFRIGEKGLKKISSIVLGRRISKSQQVSNWDAESLTAAQLRYAATDAWVCLRIYHTLRNTLSHGGE